MFDFWQVQSEKLLFPDIAWSKPEQKSQAGKLLIVGGHANSFRALATAYEIALKTGAGEVKIIAPDSLRKLMPKNILDVIFAPSEQSGGFSKQASEILKAGENWADSILIIGDLGKNSETAIVLESFIINSEKPTLVTRDAIDLTINSISQIVEKPNISLIASLQQMQKIFRTIFYPRAITFSMQLSMLADTLHKFTSTFPIEIITFHQENLIISDNGAVFSMPQNSKLNHGQLSPLRIWSGEIPAKIAVFQLWSRENRAQSTITAIAES